jgi:hypothetical protein
VTKEILRAQRGKVNPDWCKNRGRLGCTLEPLSRSEKRPGRPFGLWILTLTLLGSPAIHGSALLLRSHWLNFGSLRLWDALVYFLIAHRRRTDARRVLARLRVRRNG